MPTLEMMAETLFDPFAPRKARERKDLDEMAAAPMEAKEGFTFGADPELFVKNEKGVFVSAAGLIPGTKAEPHKVEYGAIQVDGMAAEYNIDPVTNFKDWNRNHQAVIGQLQSLLPKGYTLEPVSAVTFDPSVFDEAPEEAKELGCSPDFNAWTQDVNPPPNDPDNPRLRCAGGHIHVGWTSGEDTSDVQHLLNCIDLVKQFDWYLGAPSIRYTADPSRRRLYGRAGSCRIKDYGVEYRVLDNFWAMTRERRLWVWNRMMIAISKMEKSCIFEKVGNTHNELLQQSIDMTKLDKELSVNYRFPLATIDPHYCRFGF